MRRTFTALAVWLAVCLATLATPIASVFLRTSGSNFYYGKDKVFLSGVNIAWNHYGYDFGNGHYDKVNRDTFEDWIGQVHSNGGNSVRVWVHIEGDNSPEFDDDGFVTAPDANGTLISDLSALLDYAYDQDVFVILVLWNGEVMRNNFYKNLFYDDSKLQTFIDKSLVPLVRALKSKPSLAAWEILNEPEGSVRIAAHSNPFFDTSNFANTGAGWAGSDIPMERILRFINWQSAAVHSEDPKALVTIGSWSEIPQTDQFGFRNYYTDTILRAAGGRSNGIIDFHQIHSYTWEGSYSKTSPFKVDRWAYRIDEKPLVIGEFSADCSEGGEILRLFEWSYTKGYSGAWSWQYNEGGVCADTRAVHNEGLASIRYRNDQTDGNGGLVTVNIRY